MKFLDPTTDLTFKKVFGSEKTKDILISFLNSVLERKSGEKITSVYIQDPHNHPEIIASKSSIVDLKCEDEKKNQYIIEMQVIRQPDYAERCQYYANLESSKQLDAGQRYKKLTPVIFIGVLKFNMFESPNYLSHHKMLNIETLEHGLKLTEYHFIELPKFEKKIDKLENIIDQWAFFFQNAGNLEIVPDEFKKNKEIVHAFKVLETSNYTKSERNAYDKLVDEMRLEKARYEDAIEEGNIEKAQDIAKKLLKRNFDLKEISELTGLDIEEIKKLK